MLKYYRYFSPSGVLCINVSIFLAGYIEKVYLNSQFTYKTCRKN